MLRIGSVGMAVLTAAVVMCVPQHATAKYFRNHGALEELAAYALQCASNWGDVSRVRVRSAEISGSNWIISYTGNYTITTFGRAAAGAFNATALRVKKSHGFEIHHQALRWAEPQGSGLIGSSDRCTPRPIFE